VPRYFERVLALFRENLDRVERGDALKTEFDRTRGD
jgi:hypothetical protein